MAKMVDCYVCNFKLVGKLVEVKIEHISLDYTDDYELDKQIANNKYFLQFDKAIPTEDIEYAKWDPDLKKLTINNTTYNFIKSDLGWLANDINVDTEKLEYNIIGHLCEKLNKNR